MTDLGLFLVEDVGGHRLQGGVEDALLDLQALLGDCVAIFPVGDGHGEGHCRRILIEVDDDGGLGAALHDDLLAVFAEE